jgi:hypothetical protein
LIGNSSEVFKGFWRGVDVAVKKIKVTSYAKGRKEI